MEVVYEKNRNYIVSTDGSIFSRLTKKYLKPFKDAKGFYRVTLVSRVGKSPIPLHRLLAEVFIPNPNNFSIVQFKDGDKNNYSLDNLEWVLRSSKQIAHFRQFNEYVYYD